MGQPYIYHRIEPGDTLESLAKKYGVAPMQLVKLNKGMTNAGLKPGSFLIIGQVENDRAQQADKQREDAIAKEEEKKQEQAEDEKEEEAEKEEEKKPVQLPNQWLSDAQIRSMALQQVADNKLELEALAGEKKRALQKISQQRAEDQDQYYKKLRQINADVEDRQEDFIQDAIKQGISRSSIVDSVNDEYRKQGDKQLSQLNREASIDDQALNNAQREIIRQYNQDVAEANNRYQQQIDQAMESIKKKNQEANIDIVVGNGLDDSRQYEIADRLLGTLSKSQAADYLKRNRQVLVEAWGQDAVDKLNKKYK